MTPTEIEALFQELYDEALEIQRVARTNAHALGEAGRSLTATSAKLTQRLEQLANDMTSVVENSAERTATKTAELLREKFTEADAHAKTAADIYRSAANRLGWKAFGFALLVQTIVLIGVVWVIRTTIPSRDEIQENAVVIEQQRRHINEQQQQLATLERRGVTLSSTSQANRMVKKR